MRGGLQKVLIEVGGGKHDGPANGLRKSSKKKQYSCYSGMGGSLGGYQCVPHSNGVAKIMSSFSVRPVPGCYVVGKGRDTQDVPKNIHE